LVVLLALNGHAADVVLFDALVLVLGKLLGTAVHFVLRVRIFVIPVFVTVSSVAVNRR
jgi:hypothetical protein